MHPFKHIGTCVCLALLLALVAGHGPAAADAPAGKPAAVSSAPDFGGRGVDGREYQLRHLLQRGPVLLDFWTTWCKPCMNELPNLQKIYQKYAARGFTLLGIPSDDAKTASKIKPTLHAKGLTFPNVPDTDRRINNLYNVRNYPTTVLIAPDGSVQMVAMGYKLGDEVELEKKIVALLGPAPAGNTGQGEAGGSDEDGESAGGAQEGGGER
jgi:peroxiredoxin